MERYYHTDRHGHVAVGDRIRARLAQLDLSQSELARRVRVNQSTIAALLSGRSRSSSHLHLIARELQTTPAYLTGETDDPDEGAPPPPPTPRVQLVMMPVSLPSEEALVEMYEGQLRAFGRLQGAELARALAKRLPKALARLQAEQLYEQTDDAPDEPATASPQSIDHPGLKRSQRT